MGAGVTTTPWLEKDKEGRCERDRVMTGSRLRRVESIGASNVV